MLAVVKTSVVEFIVPDHVCAALSRMSLIVDIIGDVSRGEGCQRGVGCVVIYDCCRPNQSTLLPPSMSWVASKFLRVHLETP